MQLCNYVIMYICICAYIYIYICIWSYTHIGHICCVVLCMFVDGFTCLFVVSAEYKTQITSNLNVFFSVFWGGILFDMFQGLQGRA